MIRAVNIGREPEPPGWWWDEEGEEDPRIARRELDADDDDQGWSDHEAERYESWLRSVWP